MVLPSNTVFAAIDFETTGSLRNNIPVEFAFVRFRLDGTLVDFWESEIRVDREKTKASSRFTETLAVNSLRDCWSTIDQHLSDQLICGHNVGVDRQFLLNEFPFFQAKDYMDTLSLYRQLYGDQIDDYSLESLLSIFGLEEKLHSFDFNEHFEPHRALYDAVGSAQLLLRLYEDPETRSIFTNQVQTSLF